MTNIQHWSVLRKSTLVHCWWNCKSLSRYSAWRNKLKYITQTTYLVKIVHDLRVHESKTHSRCLTQSRRKWSHVHTLTWKHTVKWRRKSNPPNSTRNVVEPRSLKARVLKTIWSARTQVKLKSAYFEGREIRSDMSDLCSLNVLPAAAGLSQSQEMLHFTTVRHNLDGDKWVSITARVRSSLSEMKCDGDTGFTISENLEISMGMSSLIYSSPLPHSVWRKSVNLLSNRDSHMTTKWLMSQRTVYPQIQKSIKTFK